MMRRRTKAGLITLPFAVLTTLVAVKLLAMMLVSGQASAAYERGDYPSVVSLARWLTVVNVIDPWKAHFAVGDGLAGQGLDADAQFEFERALGMASATDQCPVRVNLSLVLERRGDAVLADDPTKKTEAEAFYDQALTVIDEADESCTRPPQNGEEGTDEALDSSEERVTGKKEALSEEPADPDADQGEEAPQPDDAPSDATVEELEEKLQEAGQDRSDQQTAERTPSDPEYVDKPW